LHSAVTPRENGDELQILQAKQKRVLDGISDFHTAERSSNKFVNPSLFFPQKNKKNVTDYYGSV